MDKTVLGIDIAKETFMVVLGVGETRSPAAEFPNDPDGYERLGRWLHKRKVKHLHACMEATGRYGDDLAWWLHEQGHVVSVINPARLKAYAQSRLSRTKTDGVDAGLLADFGLTQKPEAWTPPDPAWRELQAMARHLDALQATRQQELNRLSTNPPSAVVRATLEAHLAFLDEQIKALKAQIRTHIDQHPNLKSQHDLLTSIPGIGDTTADLILAEIRDLHAFDDAGQVVAYAGLNPRQRQSGKSVRGHSPSPNVAMPVCVRAYTCPPSSPNVLIPSSKLFASVWPKTANRRWSSSAPPCANYSSLPLVSSRVGSLLIRPVICQLPLDTQDGIYIIAYPTFLFNCIVGGYRCKVG